MYIKRHLEAPLLEASKHYPVIMLYGQRQVGKTTLLTQIKEPQRRYLNLNDFHVLSLALNDRKLFFETYQGPLIIDNIHRAWGLLVEIKRLIDEKIMNDQTCAGQFWLISPLKFSPLPPFYASLTDKMAVFELQGLSYAEICGAQTVQFTPEPAVLQQRLEGRAPLDATELYANIHAGCMPQVVSGESDTQRFYTDYIYTYLERDALELCRVHVACLHQFHLFLAALAARIAQEIKFDELAACARISTTTVKTWLSRLEDLGIVYILSPYAGSLIDGRTKAYKLYFADTGLVSYLCRWPDSLTLQYGAMDVAILENYVVSEIVKSYRNSGLRPDLYYYRNREGCQVQLLISKGDCLYPIEIQKNAHPRKPGKSFKILEKLSHKVMPGLVICLSDKLIPSSKELWLCPVAAL